MADPKHPRHYEEAFKRQIVQLYENGKPAREIRAEYDIARSNPRRWVQGILFLVKSVFRVSSLIFFGFRHEECRPVVCFTGCPSCRT